MLGFRLNEEQESFRLAVRAFAEKALAPRVEELERTETFPMDLFRLIEEFSRVNCGFAGALLAHFGLATIPLIELGTEEQKRTYLAAALRARSSDRSGSRSRIPARTPRPYGRRPSGAATTT
ncbi:MAG TPA: acyl-CoA dehydrogenase family protein [Candidatus Binatia bacterium]|nr:acyl-CoA dehydrogenase family protein [Candidatus Binatia bacterium]